MHTSPISIIAPMNTKILCLALVLVGLNVRAQETDSLKNSIDSAYAVQSDTSTDGLHSHYGYLLHDDPVYNPRNPWLLVSGRVLAANVFNWALDKYVYQFDWVSDGPRDWKNNFKAGPKWDD